MSNAIVNNQPALRVKLLDPAQAGAAKKVICAQKDGYDTVGVTTTAGDALVLLKTNKALDSLTTVKVDGVNAKVNFVENEINTFKERFLAPYKGVGGLLTLAAGGVIAASIAASFIPMLHITSPSVIAVGLTLWAGFGAAVMSGLMAATGVARGALGSALPAREALTDGLSKK